jgi:CO/xanthine dehydrogenase Mo-binding subunit
MLQPARGERMPATAVAIANACIQATARRIHGRPTTLDKLV